MTDLAEIGIKANFTQIKQADKALNDLAKTGGNTERQVTRATDMMSRSFAGLAASLISLVSLSSGLQKLVSVGREFDVLSAQIQTATGSMEAAAGAFAAIEDFARTTPYSLQQATKSFNQLVNLGLTPSERALRAYGNTASAMGKDLAQMVEAVADATVGEFERLKEFGIKARAEGDSVTFRFRGVTTSIKNDAASIEEYLMRIGEVNFADSMTNRMNSLDGAISNLADSWDGLFRAVNASGVGGVIESSVRLATDAVSGLTDSIRSGQLEAYLDAIAGKFDGWGADIARVLDSVSGLFSNAAEYWYLDSSESIRLIIDAFKNLPENIRTFIQIITVELSAFADAALLYGTAAAEALNPFGNGVETDVIAGMARISAAREQTIGAIMMEREAAIGSFESQIESADSLLVAYQAQQAAVDKSTDALAKYKVKTDEATASNKEFKKTFDKLDEAMLDHFEALEDLEQIELDRIKRKEQEIDATLEWEEDTVKATEQVASISEKAGERIEQAFADVWVNAFDGMESMVDGMKNAFKRMLAEMAHMALTRPIMVSLGMGGMLPGTASAGGLGGMLPGTASAGGLGGLSGGLGLLGGIGSSITGLGGMIGGAFGGGLAGAGGLIGAGQFGTLFSGAGSLLGSGNIAAGLGMSMPIIAAAVVAAMGVNKLTGGGLFGTSFKEDSRTLGLSLGGGDVSGLVTSEESRKKSLFRGTKRRTTTSAFDATGIDAAFDDLQDTLAAAAERLGIEGADSILKGFSASLNLNIKDMTEEQVNSAIQEWIGTTAEGMIAAVFGDAAEGLGVAGESALDTLIRVTQNFEAMQSVADVLGLNFDLTGKAGLAAATNIVNLVGGLEQLSSLSSQYYQEFYTEAERQAALQSDLASAFDELGVSMAMSREGFRAQVEALDLTTAEGQATYAALMQLVPSMLQYLSAIEAQEAATKAATEAAQKEAEAKATALAKAGSDLELRLMDALGQSSEALARRREMELAATDESLRALLLSIYAAEDAARAQSELAAAQDKAAASAASLKASLLDAAQDAFSKLEQSVNAEKETAGQVLELKLSAIDAEREALSSAHKATMDGYAAQESALNGMVDKLSGLSGVINDFLGGSQQALDPFKRLTQILNEAKVGLLPDQSELSSVFGAINSRGSSGFSTAFEMNRAMAVAKNQAGQLGGVVNSQLTDAQRQIASIDGLRSSAEEYYQSELERLAKAEELAISQHDEQLTKLDEQLSEAQKQLDALLGIDNTILSVDEAMKRFNEALAAATVADEIGVTAQIVAINAVEAAIISLPEMLQPVIAPPAPVTPIISRPPEDNIGEPVTREMIDLLKEINAGIESTAKHTKTSADALEFAQYEAAEVNP